MSFWKIAVLLLILTPGLCRADDLELALSHYRKGVSLESTRNYVQAIQEFQESLSLAPYYFWANRELGNCFYYLGDKDHSINAYKRYLEEDPDDRSLNSFLTNYEGKGEGKSGNSENSRKLDYKRYELGLGAGISYYSMNSWNNSVDIEAANSSGAYDNSGTPISSGISYYSNFRYQLIPKWDLGFFGDYLTASGALTQKWADSSGAYSHSGNYNFSTLFLGPEINYEFWKHSNWHFLLGGGLAYLSLFGANVSYYGQDAPYSGMPSQGNKNSTLSGSGFGGYVSVAADLRASLDFSLEGQVGYRIAQVTNFQQSQEESIEFAGQNEVLDYSGIYIALKLNYWR